MRLQGLSGLLLMLFLAGCQTADGDPLFPNPYAPSKAMIAAKNAELAVKDDETCRSYGAKPGSDIYIQCRMNRQQSRDAADNAPGPVIVNNINQEPTSYPKLQPAIAPRTR